MQPQGSHTKPPIRRALNGRVVVSDDEDDGGRAPSPPAPPSTSASRPAPTPTAARDTARSSDSGGPRRAGGPGQPHPRTKSLTDAIKSHLQPPRTVPAKRKEPVPSHSASSARRAGSEDARGAIAHEEHRAVKRVRHSPPEPSIDTPTKREERPGSLPPPPPPLPLPLAPKLAATSGTSFLQVAVSDAPKDDDRPPPPPPLVPFITRTKVSPTPPVDPMPAGGPAKRKRALSFGSDGEAATVRTKDQAKAGAPNEDKPPPAPKKKLKALEAIIAESNDRAKAGSSTPPSHPALSAVQASSTSRPATPNGARQTTPLPPPRPVKEEAPAPARVQEPPPGKSDGVKQQASGAPARARVRDADDLAKDKQLSRPAPKGPPARTEKVKREAVDSSAGQPSRPRGSSMSTEDKGRPRIKPDAPRGKPHATTEEKQPAKKGKARAEPETEPPAPSKKKKPLPLSSILKESDERKQKEQAARIPAVPSGRAEEAITSSSSSRAEPLHPERSATITPAADQSRTPTAPAASAASTSRPPPPDAAPAARKTKLRPVASIVKEADLRAAGPVQPPSRPLQAAFTETSRSDRADPREPEPAVATQPTDDLHTPPAPVQAPLPGPPVDESPRLMMAKKRASSELSFMNTALDSGQPQLKQPMHALDALLMLADTAAMAPTVARPKQERLSSEPRRESSSDTTLSARERAQQQAQSELSHTQDHPDLPKGKTPRRKLSEILEDEHDFDMATDNAASSENNTKQDEPALASSHASSPHPLGLPGLGGYGSSPEPEDANETPQAPAQLASPPAAIVQSRAPDTPKQSSPSAAVSSEAPSTDLPLKTNKAVLDLGSPPSRSTLHEPSSPAPPRPRPPRQRAEHRRVSSRMVVQSPESGAEDYSSPLSPPAQPATPEPQAPSSPAWPVDTPVEPQPEAPAPEPAAQEAPAPAPARKKYNMSFKKKTQPTFDEPEPTLPPQTRAPEREKTPPPKRLPSCLPPKPVAASLPAKPPAAAAAAPTPFGRQLPPEHSSRDVDPTSVLSSLLGKPKRDSGITPEQRREWDARKEADRAAREAEYAAQGPPLRMQRQMQTILQWESKFKAKRTNVSPNIVAAAFKQRWEKQHGTWTGVPGRRPHQERGPPPASQGRPLPPTPAPAPNDRANANSSNPSQPSQTRAGWLPVANGHSLR